MDILLTCDAGTTACKCTAFDASGRAVAQARVDYPTEYPRPGWAQQNADLYADAALRGLKQLAARIDPRSVRAIGMCGQMNGLIPVDDEGNAIYPNIIHSDSRSAPQVALIERAIGANEFYKLTGNRLDCHYTLPKMLWLKQSEPDVFNRMRRVVQSKDYVYSRLTGVSGLTDYSEASLTIALDISAGRWADGLLRALDLDPALMPELRVSHDISGRLSADAARFTGLIEGTPVAIGGGDGACAARGAGITQPGRSYCCIGSSAWVAQLTQAPVFDAQARLFNYFDMDGEHNYTCGTLQCGAAAYDWMRGMLGLDGAQGIADMESLAGAVEPGAGGVLFFPQLMGSRTPDWDPYDRGCLLGLTLFHDRRHVTRAVYEGVAMGLYACSMAMAENGLPVDGLMLTGGGARSGLWPRILAALHNCEVGVHPDPGEATSLGAAIAAGVGAGVYASYADGAGRVHPARSFEADADWVRRYASLYDIYKEVHGRVSPLHIALGALA